MSTEESENEDQFKAFVLLKFKDKNDAATFFYYYNKQKYTLCRSLFLLFVNPAKLKNQPAVQYNFDDIQTTLDRVSTWCCCATATTPVNNHSTNINETIITHTASTSTTASPRPLSRPPPVIITSTAAHHDTNTSSAIITRNHTIINTTTPASEQYTVLDVYEQEIQKLKQEIKEDESRLQKKKREIENDEVIIQTKKKKMNLLLELKGLE